MTKQFLIVGWLVALAACSSEIPFQKERTLNAKTKSFAAQTGDGGGSCSSQQASGQVFFRCEMEYIGRECKVTSGGGYQAGCNAKSVLKSRGSCGTGYHPSRTPKCSEEIQWLVQNTNSYPGKDQCEQGPWTCDPKWLGDGSAEVAIDCVPDATCPPPADEPGPDGFCPDGYDAVVTGSVDAACKQEYSPKDPYCKAVSYDNWIAECSIREVPLIGTCPKGQPENTNLLCDKRWTIKVTPGRGYGTKEGCEDSLNGYYAPKCEPGYLDPPRSMGKIRCIDCVARRNPPSPDPQPPTEPEPPTPSPDPEPPKEPRDCTGQKNECEANARAAYSQCVSNSQNQLTACFANCDATTTGYDRLKCNTACFKANESRLQVCKDLLDDALLACFQAYQKCLSSMDEF